MRNELPMSRDPSIMYPAAAAVVLVLCFLAILFTEQLPQNPQIVTVSIKMVYLFDSPEVETRKRVGEAVKGESLRIIGISNSHDYWLQVIKDDGQEGWVFDWRTLLPEEPPPIPEPPGGW